MTIANDIINTFKTYKTFTSGDVRILMKSRHKKVSDKLLQVSLSRMVKEGVIYTVIKGVFSTQMRDDITGFAFSPFYYGGLAALMMRDLIDDQVKIEVMTTRTVKRSYQAIYGGKSKIILHHIPTKYYFGFSDLKYGDITVPVSDPEKTLIDIFYYQIALSVRDYAEVLKRLNAGVLNKYLKHYDRHTRTAVIAFVKKYKPIADSGELENPY